MAEIRLNNVTFTPDDAPGAELELTLLGAFTISTGLRPNITRALVPFHEYDKLGGRPIRRGTLRFYFTSRRKPDVTYRMMRIIDVEPGLVAVPADAAVARPIEYVLSISDVRERTVPPRGGRVNLGHFNRPLPEVGAVAANAPAPVQKNPVQLMAACLRPIGILYEIVDLDYAMRDSGTPENLHWFNAWATVELQKLLDHASGVFCPQTNGSALIRNIGHGENVDVRAGRLLATASVPESDRRGKIVIFTSAPNPVIETRKIKGPHENTWEFVIQDVNGVWRNIDDPELRDPNKAHKLIDVGGPEATVRGRYVVPNEGYRDHVRRQLYHCIRLTEKFTRSAKRILRKQVNSLVIETGQPPEIKVKDIEVSAVRAVFDENTRLWKNSAEPVACTATHLDTRNSVIYVHELLGKVEVAGNAQTQTADLEASFKAMESGDLRVKLSVESAVELADEPGRFVPEYYNVGFAINDSGVVGDLVESRVASEMLDPSEDTVIISRPDLRLVHEEPADGSALTDNRVHLKKKARLLAKRYVAERQAAQTIRVKGFFGVELSGTVSEVQLDQGGSGGEGPTTTIKLYNHWSPLGPEAVLRIGRSAADGGGGEAFPEQLATAGQHLSLGSASASQPLVSLQPAPPPAPTAGTFPVRLEMDASPADSGNLTTAANFTYTVMPLTGTTKLATKVKPNFQRGVGRLEPASWGLAFIDAGKVQLLMADERFKTVVEC